MSQWCRKAVGLAGPAGRDGKGPLPTAQDASQVPGLSGHLVRKFSLSYNFCYAERDRKSGKGQHNSFLQPNCMSDPWLLSTSRGLPGIVRKKHIYNVFGGGVHFRKVPWVLV